MVDTFRKHIEIVEGVNGPRARIVGSRIRVQDIIHWQRTEGWSPEQIAEQLPTITLADVHAALAYYHDNPEVIERELASDEAYVEEMRRKDPGYMPE
jgi:uncharacterized protein (DUF433 family)